MEIDKSLNTSTKFTRRFDDHLRRTHWEPIRKGPITKVRRLPLGPEMNRTETRVSGGDSIARQRATVRDSQDDEKRSNDLFVVISKQHCGAWQEYKKKART